jgi:aspartyl protease family protein
MARARLRVAWAAALLMLAAGAAQAVVGVVLAGRMGQRALFVIDGRAQTADVGETVLGVRLLGWEGDTARVDIAGTVHSLRIGTAPAIVARARPVQQRREIVIPAGQGGHFTAAGSIRGHSVQFMVDTGATLVALGRNDAQRLGLDLSTATAGFINTANGQVMVHMVTLPEMHVGDVEVNDISAVVLPTPMPFVLLGNNFLTRFQMRRENDVMRLEAR